jgi:hypothetical protein
MPKKNEPPDFGPPGPEGARWKIPGWDPDANEGGFFREVRENARDMQSPFDRAFRQLPKIEPELMGRRLALLSGAVLNPADIVQVSAYMSHEGKESAVFELRRQEDPEADFQPALVRHVPDTLAEIRYQAQAQGVKLAYAQGVSYQSIAAARLARTAEPGLKPS